MRNKSAYDLSTAIDATANKSKDGVKVKLSNLCTAIVLVAMQVSQIATASQTELMSTANCKVVLDDPNIPVSSVRSVTWTGGCNGGYIAGSGELTLSFESNGTESFRGSTFRGSPLKGVYIKQDGAKFEGDFDPSSRRFSRGRRFSPNGAALEEGLFDGLAPMLAGKSLVTEAQRFEGTLFWDERARPVNYETGQGIYQGMLVRGETVIAYFANGVRYSSEAEYSAALYRMRQAEYGPLEKQGQVTAQQNSKIVEMPSGVRSAVDELQEYDRKLNADQANANAAYLAQARAAEEERKRQDAVEIRAALGQLAQTLSANSANATPQPQYQSSVLAPGNINAGAIPSNTKGRYAGFVHEICLSNRRAADRPGNELNVGATFTNGCNEPIHARWCDAVSGGTCDYKGTYGYDLQPGESKTFYRNSNKTTGFLSWACKLSEGGRRIRMDSKPSCIYED